MNVIKHKYNCHKSKAKHRGIDFKLTFEEWWNIWETSGKWEQRGCKAGQYNMCRINDDGAYELGNVYIASQEHNHKEAHSGAKRPVRSEQWKAKQEIAQGHSVIVNGIEYASINGASEATGLRRDTIVLRIAKQVPGYAFK